MIKMIIIYYNSVVFLLLWMHYQRVIALNSNTEDIVSFRLDPEPVLIAYQFMSSNSSLQKMNCEFNDLIEGKKSVLDLWCLQVILLLYNYDENAEFFT